MADYLRVNGADMAIWTTGQLSGQPINVKVNLKAFGKHV